MKKLIVILVGTAVLSVSAHAVVYSSDAGGTNMVSSGCNSGGCWAGKKVGYAPEYQEALALLQQTNKNVEMTPISTSLRSAINEHREKLAKENIDASNMTDLEVIQDLVKSRAADAQ